MKKQLTLLVLAIVALHFTAFSQANLRSGNINLSFPSLSVTSVNPGIGEGGGVIDNTSGNLLLQTDGYHLYNSSGAILATVGTYLGPTACDAGIILQAPGTTDQYYVFTVEGHPGSGIGLSYSIWNTTSNSLTTARTTLNKRCIEQLTSYCDSAGGYWVVSHESGARGGTSKKYVSYHLTSAGLTTTPVVSNGIMKYPTPSSNRYGTLRISPDGKRICNAFGGAPIVNNTTVEMGDFNKSSGTISNIVTLQTASSSNANKVSPNAYCSAFSPNSQVLYLGSVWLNTVIPLRQFNLLAGTTANIIASRIDVSTTASDAPWGIALAPDGRIYAVNKVNNTEICSIQNPNIAGAGCGYNSNIFPANTIYGTVMFSQTPPDCSINPCGNDTLYLGDITICKGGGYPICNQVFTVPGYYEVTCAGDDGCVHTYQFYIVYSSLTVDAGPPSVQFCCPSNLNAVATGGNPGYFYSWSPTAGLSNPNIANPVVNLSGTYTVTVTDASGCTASDAITVSFNPDNCCRIGGSPQDAPVMVNIFPNPSTDNFTLTISDHEISNMTVYNEIGQVMESHQNVSGSIQFGEELKAGIYHVNLVYKDGESSQLQIVKMAR